MIIGYARVSSTSQNLARQIEDFKAYGCERIFEEKQTAKDFQRPVYQKMKKELRFGDILVVKDLSRFGRNAKEIKEEWEYLINKEVDIVVLDMPILDTTKYKEIEGVGKLIINLVKDILSWLVEEERNRIREAQRQGIAIAKEQGKFKGRPKKYHANAVGKDKIIYDEVVRMTKDKYTKMDIHRRTGLSRNTIDGIIADLKEQEKREGV
jgi:DNA invertase Pin-like site-specific DNA recombinase